MLRFCQFYQHALERRTVMQSLRVAHVDQLPPGEMQAVAVGDKQYLVANVDGTFWALQDACPHDCRISLASGRLEGNLVVCPRHGMAFDVTTGQAVERARRPRFHHARRTAQTYPTRVDGNDVVLELP